MKNILLSLGLLFCTFRLVAQNTPNKPTTNNSTTNSSSSSSSVANTNNNPTVANTSPYLKQKKEEITVEGLLQLQIMDKPLGIVFNELKVRYFVSEKRAYRARGLAAMSNNNITINGSNGKNANVIESKQSLNLGVGFEDHFKSKNHISPYWGGEVLIGLERVSLDGTNTDDGLTFKQDYKVKSENTEFAIYVGGIAGLDYYLNTNFYIGTEIRYGYQSKNLGNVSKTVFDPLGNASNSGSSLGTNTKLEMSYTPGVRIGYKF